MLEIERKFLVLSDQFKEDAISKSHLIQGFLNSDPARTVRVRIQRGIGFLTVKGPSSQDGTARFEWETKISEEEAKALLTHCERGIIEKIRYEIPLGDHTFEVDEFLGENLGLVVAEIELKTANESYQTPTWLGKEVTGITRYYNSQLCNHPYKNWKHETNS